MTRKTVARWDVAIVGAGPAGSSAAYHLAREGHRVLLLDRSRFPRDKACGDGLTAPAVRLLADMGLSQRLSAYRTMQGVRVFTNHQGQRDFLYHSEGCRANAMGVVVPRYELDSLLTQRAVQAGAVLWEQSTALDVLSHAAEGAVLRIRQALGPIDVSARFVVLADGGGSGLAARAGLPPQDPFSVGFAVRGYYRLHDECSDFFEVHVPLVDPVSDGTLAGYGWVFPVRGTLVNIGVGLFHTRSSLSRPNLRHLLTWFLNDLVRRDRRFSEITLEGPLRGGRLPSGFTPAGCYCGRVLLAGDAAGLVDPFTGEGIDSALESGRLAAEALDDALDRSNGSPPDLRSYPQRLEERFGEHFRVGRHFVTTYGFMWKVLEQTFHLESPLFDGLRRAAIDFGVGPRELYCASDREWTLVEKLELCRDFELMAERLRAVLRSENPIFGKIARSILDRRGSVIRLALLHISRRTAAQNDAEAAAAAATAVELSQLALEIQRDVIEDDESVDGARDAGVSWANRFAVTAGNCLLVEAYRLLAALNGPVVGCVARTCAEVCDGTLGRFKEFRGDVPPSACGNVRLAGMTTGSVFAMCCQVGTLLADRRLDEDRALADFGRRLGISYHLARESDALLENADDPQRHPLARALRRRVLPFAAAWTLEHRPADGLASVLATATPLEERVHQALRILRVNGSIERTRHEALAHRRSAIRALETAAGRPNRAALLEIAAQGVVV